MDELDFLDEDPWGTVFRDVVLLALIGFVAMVIVLLPHITVATKQTEARKSPGNVVIEMHWPFSLQIDVDLWVQAPNEYPRHSGRRIRHQRAHARAPEAGHGGAGERRRQRQEEV